mmetsp:Transcript_4522/g.9597  ORF Transcript_4522/g.9597 Transcript_4522/m.9597 type:complete len:193 (-) Transcript_4522:1282-1860(-)
MTYEPPRKRRKRRGSYQRRGAIVGASSICSAGTSLSVLMKNFRLSLSESVAHSSLSTSSVAAAASAVRTRTRAHDETSESTNCSSSATPCTADGLLGSFASAPPVRLSGSVVSTASSAYLSIHVPVFTDANNLYNMKEKDKDRRNDADSSAPCATVRAHPSSASPSIDVSTQVPSLHSSFIAMRIDEDTPTE